jgi:gamma-D-glutamyl-L-lysine dipeptidyl-peptidase
MLSGKRLTVVAGALSLVAAACGTGEAGTSAASSIRANTPAHPATGASPPVAFVRVTLATVWAQPDATRPIDRPSTTRPVDIPGWLANMTTDDRRWLVGRIETQAAYGVQVAVLGHRGAWTKVAVRGQSTPRNRYGYPGWLPTAQLTTNRSLLTARPVHPVAVVVRKFAWLRSPGTDARKIQVTYATRLTVTGTSGTRTLIMTPGGTTLAIASSTVRVYPSATGIPTPTGKGVVAAARRFLGLPYLWAGTSAYGFDCSGFTYTVFRRFGIGLPRDADRQAMHGTHVALKELKPGDLLFFAGPHGTGTIHHVAIYAGSGQMLEAPHTGATVRLVALAGRMAEFATARRYL